MVNKHKLVISFYNINYVKIKKIFFLLVDILKFKIAAININKWSICQMLYLESYQWELHHYKICVSIVNVSKYDREKFQVFYIEFISWPNKMFTLLGVENASFFLLVRTHYGKFIYAS